MASSCKNCDQALTGNFCTHCGQAANTHKLNMHFIWHEIQHGLIHVDHGIFYTIRQLVTIPGPTIREFIEGKRVRHFKPVTLVVVLGTVYGLLYHYAFADLYDSGPVNPNEDVYGIFGSVIKWTTDHAAYASLLLIVTNSLASYLIFKKQQNNFAEHLVLNTFYRALSLLISLLLLPVLYFSRIPTHNPIIYAVAIQITEIFLMYWCYTGFFSGLSKIKALMLAVLTFMLMSAINTAIGYMVGWVIQAFHN
jgi:hypothetical protein